MMLTIRTTVWFSILICLASADRLIKEFIKIYPTSDQGGFFYLSYYPNENLAFGLPVPSWFSIPLIALVLIFIFYLISLAYYKNNYQLFAATTLIFIGGISNLMDRLLYGYIIDFMHLWFLPIFNLADIYLLVGLLLLIPLLTNKQHVS
ncbi:MAG: signal peptidase II [Patescibacteria group bacterium]